MKKELFLPYSDIKSNKEEIESLFQEFLFTTSTNIIFPPRLKILIKYLNEGLTIYKAREDGIILEDNRYIEYMLDDMTIIMKPINIL